MINPKTVEILKELIKELNLEEWFINLTQIEQNSICQVNQNKSNFIFNSVWAITYCLPMSRVAEIYLLPNKQDIRELLKHELLHVKLSPFTYAKMAEIESTIQNKELARHKHLQLRRAEHRLMKRIMKKRR